MSVVTIITDRKTIVIVKKARIENLKISEKLLEKNKIRPLLKNPRKRLSNELY